MHTVLGDIKYTQVVYDHFTFGAARRKLFTISDEELKRLSSDFPDLRIPEVYHYFTYYGKSF